VRDDLDGIVTAACRGEGRKDLLDAILAGIEHEVLGAGGELGDQGVVVAEAAVDEYFCGRHRWGCCTFQVAALTLFVTAPAPYTTHRYR